MSYDEIETEMTLDEIEAVVSRVSCQDYRFVVRGERASFYLQVEYEEPDIVTGKEETQYGRKWWIEEGMTKSGLIQTCFLAALTSTEHRVRESFRYRRFEHSAPRAIYSPHWNADFLYVNAGAKENKDLEAANWVQP